MGGHHWVGTILWQFHSEIICYHDFLYVTLFELKKHIYRVTYKTILITDHNFISDLLDEGSE